MMNKRHLLSGAAVALGLACGAIAGPAMAAPVLDDAVQVQSGGTTVLFTQANEANEFFQALQSLVTPAGFTDGTIFLTEPASESGEPPLFGLYSDGFTINSVNGHLNVYFISAGATADEENLFVTDARQLVMPETGSFQDVSDFYGQQPGFAAILSDVAVPEPATWAMMLLGFGGLGAVLRMRRAGGASFA
jgi:hypothetical protein